MAILELNFAGMPSMRSAEAEANKALWSQEASPHIHINQSQDHPIANLLRDFGMEGLAILLPGFGFLAASIPAFWVPLFCLLVAIDFNASDTKGQPEFFASVTRGVDLISGFHIEFFISITGISYMLGQIMFRRDPKVPDYKSFIKIHAQRPTIPQEIVRWCLRVIGKDSRFLVVYDGDEESTHEHNFLLRMWEHLSTIKIIKKSHFYFDGMARPSPKTREITEDMVEFPYNYLHAYLQERNFGDLQRLVYWSDNPRWRSKYFINSLKINLEFLFPRDCRKIFMNEAHVRLASSVWYGCEYIRMLAIVGILMGIATNLFLHFAHPSFFLLPMVMLGASIVIQSSIERTFHYQRCREVFYVLQLSLLASTRSDHVFRGLPSGAAESH
jgi:hypothetical protein